MSRRLSAWWFAVPLVIATISVFVAGLVVGASLRAPIAQTVDAAEGYVSFSSRSHVEVDLLPGQTRYVFAEWSTYDASDNGRQIYCAAQPVAGGTVSPRVYRLRPKDSVDVVLPSGQWTLIGKVESDTAGRVVVTCRLIGGSFRPAGGARFAITPSIDGSVYVTGLRRIALALALAALGVLIAAVAAVVVVAIRSIGRAGPGAPVSPVARV